MKASTYQYSRNFEIFQCSKPEHIDTAQENEAMNDEITTGQNQDTNHKYCFSDYEIIQSGLYLTEDNFQFYSYDETNPYDSFNLDNEDDKYNCPPYTDFQY